MKPSLLCPGQGSQYPGMAKTLLQEFPYTKQIYEEASESLKLDLIKLCNESNQETLQLTFNAQPTLLTTSFAWFSVLKKELQFEPFSAAGHSLGEYTALLCSGALSLSDAVRLVRTRGELMQNAVPVGKGKMAALIGLADEKVNPLCQMASQKDSVVVAANWNSPGQIVIAGHATAVDQLEKITKENPEYKIRKFIPLNVSAPFHSPLMTPVSEKFFPILESVSWNKLQFPISCNLDAKVVKEANWPEVLKKQIDHSVLWTDGIKALSHYGSDTFIEVGPSKVLSGLTKRILDNAKIFSIDSLEEFKTFEKEWRSL